MSGLLETRLLDLTDALGADFKALRGIDGDLSTLPTTAKNNLVAAIAEVHALAVSAAGSSSLISDVAGDGVTDKTWSADKIHDEIVAAKAAVKNELTNGAAAALDTFAEVAAQLAADETATAALASAVANRVRYDAAQTLTLAQKQQACENIGVGNPNVDLVARYTTAKA